MWEYACVFNFSHATCLVFGVQSKIAAFCAGFSNHCLFASLFHHLRNVLSSLNVFIKDLHRKTASIGAATRFGFVSVGAETGV